MRPRCPCRPPPALLTCRRFKAQINAKAGGDPAKLKAAFMELARTQSDCNSHSQGGELGFFGPGEMQWYVWLARRRVVLRPRMR